MGKKTKKKEQPTIEVEVQEPSATEDQLVIELPSIPNFPYVPYTTEPPKNVVLILATESGYVLGHWDGVYYFDPTDTKIEAQYGRVLQWCVLLDTDSDAVFVGDET